jgi:PKD repeat protein
VGGTEHYANYYNIGGTLRWNDLPNSLPGWTPNPYVLEVEGTQLFLLSGLYSGEVFPVGTTTVSYEAVDAAGNASSCSFTVTVVDSEYPTAVCQDVTVTLAGGIATITPGDIDAGSDDNCGIDAMTVSQDAFSCMDIGVVPVTLTVTDAAGNSSVCTANVTVVGEIPSCTIEALPGPGPYSGGPATTIYLGYGPQTVTLSATAAGGSAFTYSWSPSDGLSCSDCAAPVFTPTAEGNYEFTLTVTNEFGCSSSCTITICVLDVRVPGTNGKKVYLCHVPPGNPGNPQTLSISVNAVPSHLGNHEGDHLGACDQSCDNLKSSIVAGELISSHDHEFSVILYPNPFTAALNVSVETESEEPITLRIYDLSGKLMVEQKGIAPEQEITAGSDLMAGTYIMKVQQGSHIENVRIIKQR